LFLHCNVKFTPVVAAEREAAVVAVAEREAAADSRPRQGLALRRPLVHPHQQRRPGPALPPGQPVARPVARSRKEALVLAALRLERPVHRARRLHRERPVDRESPLHREKALDRESPLDREKALLPASVRHPAAQVPMSRARVLRRAS
jgi:hypothetical protein